MNSTSRQPGLFPIICRLLLVMLPGAAVFAPFGCDRPRPASSSHFSTQHPARVIWISPTRYEAGWPAVRSAAQAAANELGILRLEFVAAEGGEGPERLVAAVRTAAARRPDALCLWIHDPVAETGALEAARGSGALVITLGMNGNGNGAYAHINCGATQAAELLGRQLSRLPEGIRSYALLYEGHTDRSARDCYEHFKQEAGKWREIALLEERDVSEQSASAALAEILQRFRYVGLIVSLAPRLWIETPPEILLRDKSAHFATVGAAPELWPALRSGQALALAGPLDGEIGKAAIEAIISGLTRSRSGGFERTIEAEIVTAENLEDFARRYEAAAGPRTTLHSPP